MWLLDTVLIHSNNVIPHNHLHTWILLQQKVFELFQREQEFQLLLYIPGDYHKRVLHNTHVHISLPEGPLLILT